MNTRDARRLIGRHIAPRHPDLTLLGKHPLIGMTDGRVIRGFYVDPSRLDKGAFRLWAYVWPLYVPIDMIAFSLSRKLADLSPSDHASETAMWAHAAELTVGDGRAFLDALATPEDIAKRAEKLGSPLADPRHLTEIRVTSQLWIGDDRAAQKGMRRLRRALEGSDNEFDLERLEQVAELETAASAGDDEVRRLLGLRAATTAEALGVPLSQADELTR